MRRMALGIIVILALLIAGFAVLVGAADRQASQARQIRVELQDGL